MGEALNFWSWIAWALVIAAGLASLWVFAGRRAKGPRCAKCGYSMEGASTAALPLKCPECGREARRPRDLHRRERIWTRLWVVAGLLGLSYGASVVPRVMKRGWVGGIPTPALVLMTPWMTPEWHEAGGPPPGILRDEAEARVDEREMEGLWGALWLERTRWTWWRANRNGVSLKEIAGLERLDRVIIESGEETASIRASIESIATGAGMTVRANWRELGEADQAPGNAARRLAPVSGWRGLDRLCRDDSGVFALSSWTVRGDSVIVAPGFMPSGFGIFDAYDLARVLRMAHVEETHPIARRNQLLAVITTNVEPASWVENGGMVARAQCFGETAAIIAPATHHALIRNLIRAIEVAERERPCSTRAGDDDDITLARRLCENRLVLPPGPVTVELLATAISGQTGARCQLSERTPSEVSQRVIPCESADSCASALDAACERSNDLGLEWTVQNGSILIGKGVRSETTNIRVYRVPPLIVTGADDHRSHQEQMNELVSLITSTIDPEIWAENGGDEGYCQQLGDLLITSAPPVIHVRVEDLLSKLGSARAPK